MARCGQAPPRPSQRRAPRRRLHGAKPLSREGLFSYPQTLRFKLNFNVMMVWRFPLVQRLECRILVPATVVRIHEGKPEIRPEKSRRCIGVSEIDLGNRKSPGRKSPWREIGGEIVSEIDLGNRPREKSPEGENVGEGNRGADESTKERCLRAYKAGASASDLAGRFGVSRRTISRWVRELSVGKPPKPVRRTHHGRVYTPLMTIDDPRYGEALKSIMDEKGITFEDISKRSGISVSTVKRIASGARMGNFATWLALAKAVGCRIADIEDAVENG